MKLSNFLWFAGAASLSYQLVKNRKKILAELDETGQLVNKMDISLTKLKKNLAFLQSQEATVNDLAQDLQYKLKVFEQEAGAHLSQIQEIWEKSDFKFPE